VSASAGYSHTAFISSVGEVFTCGYGIYGQLGHGLFAAPPPLIKSSQDDAPLSSTANSIFGKKVEGAMDEAVEPPSSQDVGSGKKSARQGIGASKAGIGAAGAEEQTEWTASIFQEKKSHTLLQDEENNPDSEAAQVVLLEASSVEVDDAVKAISGSCIKSVDVGDQSCYGVIIPDCVQGFHVPFDWAAIRDDPFVDLKRKALLVLSLMYFNH
jgi:hypothetical protein